MSRRGSGKGRRDITTEGVSSDGSAHDLAGLAQPLKQLVGQASQESGQPSGRGSSHKDPQERFWHRHKRQAFQLRD
ncbi:hypothetical protein F511_04533 [Dorcoceras hygrometricum]|uniref:Uncharacterized protein n=1 Tax=Dorcoceras hygrometricum TaxID=472368 RepID=A0A2Z7BZ18_9LAMI|nr:hypothetical protein F511_04533 [Dorcoceras hygrometricum]